MTRVLKLDGLLSDHPIDIAEAVGIMDYFHDRQALCFLSQAYKYLNGDLEAALWRLLQCNPRVLARMLRLIFKPHSVVV